jgi:hypothetical protein
MGAKGGREGAMKRIWVTICLAAAFPAMTSVAHDWKMVPGRSDVLVDMASIRPLGIHDNKNGPPFWDTAVTLKFKGQLIVDYWVDCEPGVTLDTGDGEYRIENRVIGRTPDAKIRKLVCPVRHPH